MNRRHFLHHAFAVSALTQASSLAGTFASSGKAKLFVFSKMFQWISDYNQLAETVAQIGFNGLDLTVRPGGHVIPERVEDDLPRVVEACSKHRLDRPMMVSAITDANPQAERILKTAKALGITHYRMGYYTYDLKRNISAQLEAITARMKDVAALNATYGIIGQYQNHSGNYMGAGIWDIQRVLSQINSPFLGSQYDINHATYEASSCWQTGFALIAPHITSLAIKDFVWEQKNGKWAKEGCPLGQGMVHWSEYRQLLQQHGLNLPLTMHYEFPLGGAENGARTLNIPQNEFLAAIRKDFTLAREWWG